MSTALREWVTGSSRAQLGEKDEGLRKSSCRRGWGKVLDESAPVFNRNDAGLQPPIQAVVCKGMVQAEPKRRFPGNCGSTLALTRGHGAALCKERLLRRKPPSHTPFFSHNFLFHSCFPKIVLTLMAPHAAARRGEALAEWASAK